MATPETPITSDDCRPADGRAGVCSAPGTGGRTRSSPRSSGAWWGPRGALGTSRKLRARGAQRWAVAPRKEARGELCVRVRVRVQGCVCTCACVKRGEWVRAEGRALQSKPPTAKQESPGRGQQPGSRRRGQRGQAGDPQGRSGAENGPRGSGRRLGLEGSLRSPVT